MSSSGETKVEQINVNIDENDFVSKHQDEINLIKNKVVEIIKTFQIDVNVKNMNTSKILKILSEINKTIKNVKIFKQEIEDLNDGDRFTVLFMVTTNVINSQEVSQHLSKEVRDQIINFSENGEAVSEVANMIDWVADEVLEGYDKNQDGVVTSEEIEQSCNKSCSCCPKGLGRCWASFFIGFLCCKCGQKEIRYSSKN